MNIKKILVGTGVAAFMLGATVAPAFAAQPSDSFVPGCVGAAVSGQAHAWDGRGEVVSAIAVTGEYGSGVQAYLALNPCGH